MGWTSSPRYYNPTALRRIYATEFNPEKVTVVGWCGSWLKCIDKANDRPFLICVLVSRFRKNEYGYKDICSSSGPYYFNQAAVKWLKRELAKRNMEPYNQCEADLILRHDRKERQDKYIKSLTRGHELTVIDDFSCTNGAEFHVGDKFIFEYFDRGLVHVRTATGMRYRLSKECFFRSPMDDYPLAVVA